MIRSQDLSYALCCAFRFLVNGKLIRPDRLVFVNARLQVPAGKVTAISAREGTGSESADGRALPVAVVDERIEFRLSRSGVGERFADGALPGNFGNCLARPEAN